ncbi:MAG: hypothetical protein K1X28_07565 [Parachlamydiales bacterium]|nr:hypothetical protein [Parachlamydiales bacterium]
MFKHVPLPSDSSLPEKIQKKLHELPPANVFRMLANMPNVFEPYLNFAKAMYDTAFDRKLRQMALLRAAVKVPTRYLIAQYTSVCKTLGAKDAEIEAILKENPVHSLSEEANFLCKIADELTLKSDLSNETFQAFFQRYSIETGAELLLFMSAVSMMGRFINATRLEIEKNNPLEGKSTFFPK